MNTDIVEDSVIASFEFAAATATVTVHEVSIVAAFT
jgi:hypothetical protein